MKRTYVDIIGEYYDSKEDILAEANQYGIRGNELLKAYRVKNPVKRRKLEA